MQLTDWFDPKNMDHMRAYKHLNDTGKWPEGFIPDDLEFRAGWPYGLAMLIVDRHLEMLFGK